MTVPSRHDDKQTAMQPAEETIGFKMSSQPKNDDDVAIKLAQGWTLKTEWKLRVVVDMKRVGGDPNDDDPRFAEIWGNAFLLDKDDKFMDETVRDLPERKHRVHVDYGERSLQHSVTRYDLQKLPGKAVVVMKEWDHLFRDLGQHTLTIPVPAPGATKVRSETAVFGDGNDDGAPSQFSFSMFCDAHLVTELVPRPEPKWKTLLYINLLKSGKDDEPSDALVELHSIMTIKDGQGASIGNHKERRTELSKTRFATPQQFFVLENTSSSLPATINIDIVEIDTPRDEGGVGYNPVGRKTLQVKPIPPRSGATFSASEKESFKAGDPRGPLGFWLWEAYYELYRVE